MNITASRRLFSRLLYAKRIGIGQGSKITVKIDSDIPLTYKTFWNDFTHYSYYDTKGNESEIQKSSIDFESDKYHLIQEDDDKWISYVDPESFPTI